MNDFSQIRGRYSELGCITINHNDNLNSGHIIAYKSVYDSKDEVRKRGYWMPGIPVSAFISKVERNSSSGRHILNSYM